MKKLLLTMTALAGLAAAAPAAAQFDTQVWSGVDIRNRIAALDNRIDAGVQAGVLSSAEEEGLLDELADLRRLEQRYSYNGLTWDERRDLQQRLIAMRDRISMADSGRFDSDTRYGSWMGRGNARLLSSADFRDRILRLENRLNAGIRMGEISRSEEIALHRQLINLRALERQYSYNGLSVSERENLTAQLRTVRQNIAYADNGRFDRDTRYSWMDNDFYGSGGPIESVDACVDRGSGLSAVFDNVLGRSCLRVGDLANRNLFAVPSRYRYQYPDGDGVYYRFDGNLIYAIDVNTNRVVSSFDVD